MSSKSSTSQPRLFLHPLLYSDYCYHYILVPHLRRVLRMLPHFLSAPNFAQREIGSHSSSGSSGRTYDRAGIADSVTPLVPFFTRLLPIYTCLTATLPRLAPCRHAILEQHLRPATLTHAFFLPRFFFSLRIFELAWK